MKVASFVFASLIIVSGFTSCKKCYTCTVLDDENNAEYTYPEICGTKRDLKQYEARCEAEFGTFDFNCACGLSN